MRLFSILPPLLAISFSFGPCASSRVSQNTPTPKDVIYPVEVVYPRIVQLPRIVRGEGVFLASDKLTLKASLNGVVENMLVGEGDRVNLEDPLISFHGQELENEMGKKQAELKEAEAQLENDQKNFGLPIPDPRKSPIFLDEEPPTPDGVPDKLEPIKLETTPSPKKEEPVGDYLARIRLDEAVIERLNKELDELEARRLLLNVVAPFSGIIQKKFVTGGASVLKGEPLLTLVRFDPITLSVAIPQEVSAYVDKLIPVKASPVEALDMELAGAIFYISPSIDTITRTLEIRLHLPNGEGLIREGQKGIAEVHTRKVDRVFVLPKKALIEEGGDQFIYVVHGQKVEKVKVELGQAIPPDELEIVANLRVDDPVVSSGQELLKDGSFIRPSKDLTTPAQ